VTPKANRPAHLRPVPDHDASPVDDVIESGADAIFGEDDPIGAELWSSGLLDVFDSARWQARLAGQEVPPFEAAVLERCRQRRDRESLVLAASLAAVLPPPLDDHGRQVVDELRGAVAGPVWLDDIGRPKPRRAWIATDVFGDQDSVVVGFTQPDERISTPLWR
jgi:hypothetical protein